MQAVDEIVKEAQNAINNAGDLPSLDHCRVAYLGKSGKITLCLKGLGTLPLEERKAVGQQLNVAKEQIAALIEAQKTRLEAQAIQQQLTKQTIDITLPGRSQPFGTIHPIVQTMERLLAIFGRLGFEFVEGPEIEDDYHNFTALNIPALHPARAMQDTFYFENGNVLRTHTSPVQIRAMKKMKPPLRIISMGRVYRRDFDITHTPMFHQIECLAIEEHLSMADLKGVLIQFLKEFFSEDIAIRFRPSYFPFTEPSAEVDMSCLNCQAKGCRICKQTGWLEVLGCGMVHPNVLNEAGIDSQRYRGYALGCGIDRLTLLKYDIPDLRSLFENDLRFLRQF